MAQVWDDYEDTPNYPFYLKLWGKMEAEGWVMESGRGGEVTFFSPPSTSSRKTQKEYNSVKEVWAVAKKVSERAKLLYMATSTTEPTYYSTIFARLGAAPTLYSHLRDG